ncbi:hypothetical protein P689_122148 [Candidatus Riesia pediculischaeffi PTSU]|uniref:Uncharacterized protein n=1 Tax=Candidatus Riesia pediculischaeffi PTSU TaxID=1401651 RepID=A0A0C1V6B4_9ENTR|nr:hypothetical protein P689_122148 [Candidatus Riesia pediculischaeffi PTSU]
MYFERYTKNDHKHTAEFSKFSTIEHLISYLLAIKIFSEMSNMQNLSI